MECIKKVLNSTTTIIKFIEMALSRREAAIYIIVGMNGKATTIVDRKSYSDIQFIKHLSTLKRSGLSQSSVETQEMGTGKDLQAFDAGT